MADTRGGRKQQPATLTEPIYAKRKEIGRGRSNTVVLIAGLAALGELPEAVRSDLYDAAFELNAQDLQWNWLVEELQKSVGRQAGSSIARKARRSETRQGTKRSVRKGAS